MLYVLGTTKNIQWQVVWMRLVAVLCYSKVYINYSEFVDAKKSISGLTWQ